MRTFTSQLADMAEPDPNPHFRHCRSQRPMTPRQLEHAADLEQAHGNAQRAELLSWQAHAIRSGAEASR